MDDEFGLRRERRKRITQQMVIVALVGGLALAAALTMIGLLPSK